MVILESEYLDKLRALNHKYFKDKKKYLDEYRQYEKEYYDGMLNVMNTVITAVTDTIDEQIEQLQSQKESIEEYYSVQIEAIQETINGIQEENEEIDKNMALQKSRYNLMRSLYQRTRLIYREGRGFVYESDPKAVKDAEEEVRQAEKDKLIYDLEKKITALEKAMKKETDTIDDQIKSLEKYKQKWTDVVKDYERGINKQIAAMILGKDWEKKVLDQRLDILNAFKDKYIGIQEAMKQAALDAANASADPTGGSGSGSGSGGYSGSGEGKGEETPVIKHENANKKVRYKYNGSNYTSEQQAVYARAQDAQKAYNDKLNAINNSPAGTNMPQSAKEKAAQEAKAAVMARKISMEYYARGGVVRKNKGDDILTSLANNVGEDKIIAVQEGERILTPLQNKNFEKLVNLSEKLVPVLDNNFAGNMFNSEFSKLLAIAGTGGTQTVQNTFHVSLPNIHDGSKAVDLFNEFQTLATKGVQYFNGKK